MSDTDPTPRLFRPGPPSYPSELAPGGVIISVYAEDGTWLLDKIVRHRAGAASAGRAARDEAAELAASIGSTFAVVTFDGDTGARAPFDLVGTITPPAAAE